MTMIQSTPIFANCISYSIVLLAGSAGLSMLCVSTGLYGLASAAAHWIRSYGKDVGEALKLWIELRVDERPRVAGGWEDETHQQQPISPAAGCPCMQRAAHADGELVTETTYLANSKGY